MPKVYLTQQDKAKAERADKVNTFRQLVWGNMRVRNVKATDIAKAWGCSPANVYHKLKEPNLLRVYQLATLAKMLHLSDKDILLLL